MMFAFIQWIEPSVLGGIRIKQVQYESKAAQ